MSERQGDIGKRQALIERHTSLIPQAARRFEAYGADDAELMGAGAIGLIRAANSYHPDAQPDFAAHALRCIVREMALYLYHSGRAQFDLGTYQAVMKSLRADMAAGRRAIASRSLTNDGATTDAAGDMSAFKPTTPV